MKDILYRINDYDMRQLLCILVLANAKGENPFWGFKEVFFCRLHIKGEGMGMLSLIVYTNCYPLILVLRSGKMPWSLLTSEDSRPKPENLFEDTW